MAGQRGFVLLGLTGAVFFISLVLAGWVSKEVGEEEKKQVDLTRDVIIRTAEVLYQYRLKNSNTWPAAMSDLTPYAPVLAANARNGVGQPLSLAPPTPANHPTDPTVIRTDLLNTELAEKVRSEFPGQARAGTGSTVEIEIPIPGHEPPTRVQELLVRDGTRDMAGDLDMGGNDIDDVGSFLINERLIIGGEILDVDRARFLVQMAGLNCGSNQLLNIAGKQASCVNFSPTDSRPVPPPVVPPAVPGVSITGGSAITEGDTAVFTLTPTVPFSSAVTVVLGVTDDGGDFVAAGDEGRKTVMFPAGAASVTWSVGTVDDSTAESGGRVTVEVRSGTGYVPYAPTSASVDVSDNDGGTPSVKPVITINGGSDIDEGGTAVFTINADRSSTTAITISLDVSDDPDPSNDFLTSSREGRKTVSLPAGDTSVRYSLRTEDDTADEPDGRVSVRIATASSYAVGSPASAHVDVNDNDPGSGVNPVITINGGSAITEGGTAFFTISANRSSTTAITISLDVSDDPGSSDFLASSREGRKTVSLPAGDTSVRYSLPTVDDTADEPDGRVSVRIATASSYAVGSPASAHVNVTDDDATSAGNPVITITGRPGSITEGADAAFTLRADRTSAAAISINLDVSDDVVSDFLASSSEGRKSVTLPAGRTTVGYDLPTEDDNVDEPNGRVNVRIATASGYAVGSPASASVNVNDDDMAAPSTPRITIAGGGPVTEGGDAVFTVRSDRVPVSDLSISLDVSDDPGSSDFLSSSSEGRKSVSLAAGVTNVRYPVRTVDDTVDELDGRVGVQVIGAAGYTAGTPAFGSVSVRDDDPGGCPRPADLPPDAIWSGPPDCESSCGAVRVRNVLTIVNDQTTGRSWYQLTDISGASDCPVVNIGIGGNRRWKTRCDPESRAGDYLRACGPWQSQIYETDEGACGVEYCLATPLSFNLVRGRGHLASTAGSLECPDPGATTFAGIDFTTYRCRYIQSGVNNSWSPR